MATKKPKERKTKFLIARCTESEHGQLSKAAKKVGMSLGQWLRVAAWEKFYEKASAV